jgi:hypothetical protein
MGDFVHLLFGWPATAALIPINVAQCAIFGRKSAHLCSATDYSFGELKDDVKA